MRPQILFPLFAELPSLKGVGPRLGEKLTALCGRHVVDLLWHMPFSVIDRRYAPTVAEAEIGAIGTLTLRVEQHQPGRSRKQPYKVLCSDDTGFITLVFFHAHADYLKKSLPEGEIRIVSGKIEAFGEAKQIAHPDHMGTEEEREQLQTVEPVYPLTSGVSLKVLGKAISAALSKVEELPEWLDEEMLRREKWPPWKESLLTAHAPDSHETVSPLAPVRQRLAYDELLANQLALTLVRRSLRRVTGRSTSRLGMAGTQLRALLPYKLTGAQETALKEIDEDMKAPQRMLRLLHGDVGSGKTIVALFAVLAAIENGHQAGFMAPTEILARQHFETLSPYLDSLGIKAAVLTGREKGKIRETLLVELEAGDIQLLIGTHALFQEDVKFNDLAFVVIDEQHKFGVHQRITLAAKGQAVDVLVMTATPIPRTLLLTAYGDMDVSKLDEKPAGRHPVKTIIKPNSALEEVVSAISRAISAGTKVYWVCPLVEESDKLDVAAAEKRFDHLKSLFGDRVALVHGRMKGEEKDRVMQGFAFGDTSVLVATTVIEVGVNVPEATVMVVEHAERFGLAQLHQLRGRIGRGADVSTCILLYAPPLTDNAEKRLRVLRDTDDGFIIAEEDLKLRGGGELLGTRQSGLPEFKLADLSLHGDLLATARKDAALILETDPELKGKRGQALRTLLYLFERESAVKLLRSG